MRALLATLLMAPLLALAAPRIPLAQGTVFTHAASFPSGDEEHIVTLTALDDAAATFSVEFRSTGDAKKAESFTRARKVRRQDLVTGNRINQIFQDGDAETFPGATFMHLSAAALTELKTKGETALVLGTIKDYEGMSRDSLFTVVVAGRKYFRGTLKMIGSENLAVIVNGKRQLLPAIVTSGSLSVGGDEIAVKYWWLDDADNALALRSQQSQLVRIDVPEPAPEKTLAQDLSTGDCRATLPGIYFDTGSANLLSQSNAALTAVATLLKANPAWTLTVEGHTDNVGTAAYNLDLSKRRAAAVQAALQKSHAIPAHQLKAEGFGLTRPVQDNTSLDGRAANRRVELVRNCH